MAIRNRFFYFLSVILIIYFFSAAEQRKPHMSRINVLKEKAIMFTIPLNEIKFGLTYQMDDMGILNDRIPNPIYFNPIAGLFLIDPGKIESPVPNLLRISPDLHKLFSIDLLKALQISEIQTPEFLKLTICGNRTIALLYSLQFNSTTNQYSECSYAQFDLEGKFIKIIPIPDLKSGKDFIPLEDDQFWYYKNNEAVTGWQFYKNNIMLHKVNSTIKNVICLQDGSLLLLQEDNKTVCCDINGNISKIKVIGNMAKIDAVIQGTGQIFGILSFTNDAMISDGKDNLLQTMSVQVAYYDLKNKTVLFFPENPISSNLFNENDIPKHFEYYNPVMMQFDEKGNFYCISRTGPKKPELTVYKMMITNEAQEIIRN